MLILCEICRWNSIWFVYVKCYVGVKSPCCSEFVMAYEQLGNDRQKDHKMGRAYHLNVCLRQWP